MDEKQCPKCETTKPVSHFAQSSKSRDGLQHQCRDCHRSYVRQHYLNNRDRYLDKSRRTKYRIMELVREIKTNTPCADCGRNFPAVAMDFDHVRGEKVKDVSSLYDYGERAVMEEIAKCDVVCACCHRIRTEYRTKNPIIV